MERCRVMARTLNHHLPDCLVAVILSFDYEIWLAKLLAFRAGSRDTVVLWLHSYKKDNQTQIVRKTFPLIVNEVSVHVTNQATEEATEASQVLASVNPFDNGFPSKDPFQVLVQAPEWTEIHILFAGYAIASSQRGKNQWTLAYLEEVTQSDTVTFFNKASRMRIDGTLFCNPDSGRSLLVVSTQM